MSLQSNNIGCGLWMALTTLLFAFLTFPSNSPTPTPTAIPASLPIIETLTSEKTDKYFVVQDNVITYTYSSNLGQPCYYEMAGHVTDIKGQPFSNFVVNIKMLSEIPAPSLGYGFPGEGGNIEDGSSAWGVLLPQNPDSYELWLTDKIDGEELSDHIIVLPQGCNHNLATINFVQIKPFP